MSAQTATTPTVSVSGSTRLASPNASNSRSVYTVKSVYLTLYGYTLKPQNNGPLYSDTVIGTLVVDGWAVTLGTAMKDCAGWGPAHLLLAVPNATAHPSTAIIPTS